MITMNIWQIKLYMVHIQLIITWNFTTKKNSKAIFHWQNQSHLRSYNPASTGGRTTAPAGVSFRLLTTSTNIFKDPFTRYCLGMLCQNSYVDHWIRESDSIWKYWDNTVYSWSLNSGIWFWECPEKVRMENTYTITRFIPVFWFSHTDYSTSWARSRFQKG